MDLDIGEQNPMWAWRSALAASPHASHRGRAPREGERACRIALTTVEVQALLAGAGPIDCLTQVVTWDAPLALLADDGDLAARLRAMGVRVTQRGGTYAERQWDAREALEEVAHRYYDHGEMAWGVRGMITHQPHFTVAVVEGAPPVRSLLAALMSSDAGPGIALDARDPRDLRVFGVESLDHDRVIVVRADRSEECRRDSVIEQVLRELVTEA